MNAAVATNRPLLFLFVLDDETPGRWKLGGASRWWLHRSLEALQRDIAKRGGKLVLRRGEASDVVQTVVREIGAGAVFWNPCYEPYAVKRDRSLKDSLKASGMQAESSNGALLQRYDADGGYVRRWIPELAALPDDVLHRPWTASPDVLRAAGVELGRTYPRPLVDHAEARARALAAFASVSSSG